MFDVGKFFNDIGSGFSSGISNFLSPKKKREDQITPQVQPQVRQLPAINGIQRPTVAPVQQAETTVAPVDFSNRQVTPQTPIAMQTPAQQVRVIKPVQPNTVPDTRPLPTQVPNDAFSQGNQALAAESSVKDIGNYYKSDADKLRAEMTKPNPDKATIQGLTQSLNNRKTELASTADIPNTVPTPVFRQGSINAGIQTNQSAKDIGNKTGLSEQEVQSYIDSRNPGYQAKNPIQQAEDLVGGIVKGAAGIVTKPFATAMVNENDASAKIKDINQRYQSGQISFDRLKQEFNDNFGNVIGTATKFDPQLGIAKANPLEQAVSFGQQFAQQGVDTAGVIPVTRGIMTGKDALVLAAKELGEGATSQQIYTQAAKHIAVNQAKQASVFGTATTANDVVQGNPITPESVVANYAAPAALGTAAELGAAGTGLKRIIKSGETSAILPENVPTQKTNPTIPEILPGIENLITPAKNGVVQQLKKGFVEADQPIIDELRNIEKQTGQKGLVDKFIYNSNVQRGSNAVANVDLGNSSNIHEAIAGLSKKDYQDFSKYANARTELASASENTPLSQPRENLQAIVDQGNPVHDARFTALNAHYKELADTAHKAGLISDEQLANYKANDNYVRIQRDMGDLLPGHTGPSNSYSLGSTVMDQRRKGSSKDILPAGETAANYTQQIYREAAKNKTSTHLLDTLTKYGLAEKLDSAAAARHQNVSKLLRNGEVEHYKVSPSIKEAIDNINPYHMNVVMQILSAPGRVLRAGVTGLNPVFIARNLVKDQVGTAINSEKLAATHNPKSFFSGLFNATSDAVGLNNDPLYQDFLRHYGDTTSYDLTRNLKSTKQVVDRIRGGRKVGVIQAIKSPIRSAENIASITEKSTRFQNYRGAYKTAVAQGLSPEDASEKAAMAAWQNSVDFSRAGTWGRTINTVIPYWNPATQGVRQMARTFQKHPIKSSLTGTALIGVPIAASTTWNLSNPDTAAIYNNIPEYEKDNNIILIPPGTKQNQDGSYDIIKIPLPPGYKDAFMPIRRSIEAYASAKPLDFSKVASDILQTVGGPVSVQSPGALAGSFIPQAVKPIIQQYANQDLFTGAPIVPDYMQNATDAQGNPIPESKKAYPHSSGSADLLGGLTGTSPVRIEKAIKDIGGTVGLQGLNAVDTGLAKVGIIPKENIGGQSVATGLKKSFGSAQGIDNANKSAGAKYFDSVTAATKGLTQNEQAAFTSLHPAQKNFLGDQIYDTDTTYNPAARLDVYNRYPKVFAADKQLDQKNRDAGQPGNPLFDLTPAQVKKVLEKDNLPPGAKDPELSNLYNQSWYSDYAVNKSNFFKAIQDNQSKDLATAQKSGDTKKTDSITASMDKFKSSSNPYPNTSPELQKTMDTYSALPKGNGSRSTWIKSNPKDWAAMQGQFAAVDDWQNKQRGERGLAATEGAQGQANGFASTSGSSSYSKSGGSSGSKTAGITNASFGKTGASPTIKITKGKVVAIKKKAKAAAPKSVKIKKT